MYTCINLEGPTLEYAAAGHIPIHSEFCEHCFAYSARRLYLEDIVKHDGVLDLFCSACS